MSIDEIKDINKLRDIAKTAIRDRNYLYDRVQETGDCLGKEVWGWDGKSKNLLLYAQEVIDQWKTSEKCYKFIIGILSILLIINVVLVVCLAIK